jgi:hypothetical protein
MGIRAGKGTTACHICTTLAMDTGPSSLRTSRVVWSEGVPVGCGEVGEGNRRAASPSVQRESCRRSPYRQHEHLHVSNVRLSGRPSGGQGEISDRQGIQLLQVAGSSTP